MYRLVGVNIKYSAVAPLDQLQPSNVVSQPPISFDELINLHDPIKDAQRYLDNSENQGVTRVQLGEQFTRSADEIDKLNDRLQRMEGCLIVYKSIIQTLEEQR